MDGIEVDGQEQEQGEGRKAGASTGKPAGKEAPRAARHNAGAAEAAGAGGQDPEESVEDQLSVVEAQKHLLDHLLGESCIAYTGATREERFAVFAICSGVIATVGAKGRSLCLHGCCTLN